MIQLAFPAFVRRQGLSWRADVLLGPPGWMVGFGSDPAAAIDALERHVQQAFRTIGPEHDALLAGLGWEPEDLGTAHVAVPLGAGRAAAERRTLAATFTRGGSRYVVVPRLERWFVVPDDPEWEQALARSVAAARRDDEEEDPPEEAELRADRVMPARARLYPTLRGPSFAQGGGDAAFAALFSRGTPSGPEALAALADELEGPERAAVEAPRSEEIVAALRAEPPVPVALVGPVGVGRKTLAMDAFARWIAAVEEEDQARWEARLDSGRVELSPAAPRPPRFYHLDPQRIVTGMSIVGEWQRRFEAALRWVADRRQQELKEPGGDVLFVDDPVGLARAGRSAGSELVASVLLRRWLERGAFPMVVVATPEQWARLVELDRPFAELFRVVRLAEPDHGTVVCVVQAARVRAEAAGPSFEPRALRRIFELHAQLGSALARPGALVAQVERLAEAGGVIGPEAVDASFARDTGLRPQLFGAQVLDDAALRATLQAELVDQPAAIDALAGAVHALRSGLRPRRRPIASWLFVGPTGVGKTEAAKVLTRALFTTDEALLRFDLNAYADPGAVHRLLGTAGGLTTAVRRRPFAVVLLDEVEKAHPAVHDLLLQVLDEGRLTDAEGRTTSFEGTILVMTSNVGATEAANSVGFGRGSEDLAQVYRSAVAKAFRPELVNRIDRIVPFASLSSTALRAVARIQLERLLARDGFRNRTALFDVAPEALDAIANDAWDPRFGARGVKRALERRIVAGAAATLAGLRGDEPIRVSVRYDGELRFAVAALRWAEPVAPLAPMVDPTARVEALTAQLAAMRPERVVIRSPRPPGEPDYAELLALDEALRDLAAPEPEEALPAPDRALIRAGASRRGVARAERRPGYRSPRRDPDLLASRGHGGLRAALFDLLRGETPATESARVDAVRFAAVRLAALEGASESTVTLRPEVRGSAEAWRALSERLWSAWERVAERAGGEWEGRGDERIARGCGLCALVRLDSGLHWWLPPDGAAVVASLAIDGAVLQPESILRIYAPPASPADPGAVNDLRSDAVAPLALLTELLPSWALRARGEVP